MITIFEYKCLLGMVTRKVVRDPEEEQEDFDSKNRKVVILIKPSVTDWVRLPNLPMQF
jgi:hypothetical protein